MSEEKASPLVQVGIRFPVSLLARLDERVAKEQAQHPGRTVGRSELVRKFVFEGLAELDREEEPVRRKRTGRSGKG